MQIRRKREILVIINSFSLLKQHLKLPKKRVFERVKSGSFYQTRRIYVSRYPILSGYDGYVYEQLIVKSGLGLTGNMKNNIFFLNYMS